MNKIERIDKFLIEYIKENLTLTYYETTYNEAPPFIVPNGFGTLTKEQIFETYKNASISRANSKIGLFFNNNKISEITDVQTFASLKLVCNYIEYLITTTLIDNPHSVKYSNGQISFENNQDINVTPPKAVQTIFVYGFVSEVSGYEELLEELSTLSDANGVFKDKDSGGFNFRTFNLNWNDKQDRLLPDGETVLEKFTKIDNEKATKVELDVVSAIANTNASKVTDLRTDGTTSPKDLNSPDNSIANSGYINSKISSEATTRKNIDDSLQNQVTAINNVIPTIAGLLASNGLTAPFNLPETIAIVSGWAVPSPENDVFGIWSGDQIVIAPGSEMIGLTTVENFEIQIANNSGASRNIRIDSYKDNVFVKTIFDKNIDGGVVITNDNVGITGSWGIGTFELRAVSSGTSTILNIINYDIYFLNGTITRPSTFNDLTNDSTVAGATGKDAIDNLHSDVGSNAANAVLQKAAFDYSNKQNSAKIRFNSQGEPIVSTKNNTTAVKFTDTAAVFSTDIDVGSKKILNLPEPLTPQEPATKNYVDSLGSSFTILSYFKIMYDEPNITTVEVIYDIPTNNGGVFDLTKDWIDYKFLLFMKKQRLVSGTNQPTLLDVMRNAVQVADIRIIPDHNTTTHWGTQDFYVLFWNTPLSVFYHVRKIYSILFSSLFKNDDVSNPGVHLNSYAGDVIKIYGIK